MEDQCGEETWSRILEEKKIENLNKSISLRYKQDQIEAKKQLHKRFVDCNKCGHDGSKNVDSAHVHYHLTEILDSENDDDF